MAYFPNGSAGVILNNQCSDCPIGRHPDAPCPVLEVQLFYNYDQCDNEKLEEAMNTLVDEKGICQMRKAILKYAYRAPEGEVTKQAINPNTVMPAMRDWLKKRLSEQVPPVSLPTA
jgi:hypothetical protein